MTKHVESFPLSVLFPRMEQDNQTNDHYTGRNYIYAVSWRNKPSSIGLVSPQSLCLSFI